MGPCMPLSASPEGITSRSQPCTAWVLAGTSLPFVDQEIALVPNFNWLMRTAADDATENNQRLHSD